jgi:26S proteasome regulatory subunit N6
MAPAFFRDRNSLLFARSRSSVFASQETTRVSSELSRDKREIARMTVEDMEVEKVVEVVEGGMDDEEEEEDVSDLETAFEEAEDVAAIARIPLMLSIIQTMEKTGPLATQIKERAVYAVVRAYCETGNSAAVTTFLRDNEAFLSTISKAKTAKLVRQILDIVCASKTTTVAQQEEVARSILDWCVQHKRSFLRQRVEAKLAAVLYAQKKYAESISLVDKLLHELKKLDDKQLLVETHLLESQLHFSLRNVPKSKAALTASRTAANAIYVSPAQQAALDSQSGTIHTEEADYATAHSYFLEAFEQLDAMNDSVAAVKALKYMMLCKILDGLKSVLAGKTKTASSSSATTESMLSGKQAVKYAGKDLEAMQAIAVAAGNRNLKELQAVLTLYPEQLQADLLIQHHLHILQEQLLESNLLRIVEPYSCVELEYVAQKIELSVSVTERKLSQMILDGILQGILDQGKGQLVLYEDATATATDGSDSVTAKGLQVVANMDAVVTSLFERSKALRTVMM